MLAGGGRDRGGRRREVHAAALLRRRRLAGRGPRGEAEHAVPHAAPGPSGPRGPILARHWRAGVCSYGPHGAGLRRPQPVGACVSQGSGQRAAGGRGRKSCHLPCLQHGWWPCATLAPGAPGSLPKRVALGCAASGPDPALSSPSPHPGLNAYSGPSMSHGPAPQPACSACNLSLTACYALAC